MTARRTFKPADFAEQTAFARQHCRICPRQLGCTILADARPLDETDPDYPAELVIDDFGRPSCTAFEAAIDREADAMMDVEGTLPPFTSGPLPPAPAPEAAAAAPSVSAGRRAARGAAKRAKPVTIRADRAVTGIVITTRTGRDGTNLSSTVRLQLAGAGR